MADNNTDADTAPAGTREEPAGADIQPGWSPMEFAAEQEALEFCQHGRKEAFKPLVDAYFVRCVRIARAIVGDAEDAKDLAQEAFIAAYRAIDQFTLGRPFYPWLRGILVNRCKVHLRTRRRALARSKAAAARPGNWVLGAEVSPSPERRRTTDLVRRAMDTLSADDREILVLKHMEGHSYDELAEALGIGSGTVASRLYRARAWLKEALEELDPTLVGAGKASTSSGEEE